MFTAELIMSRVHYSSVTVLLYLKTVVEKKKINMKLSEET